MENRSEKGVWLVTGAAGALGSEVVRRLLDEGRDCIALDRDERGLNRLHDALQTDGLTPPALMPLDLAGAGPDDYAKLADTIESSFGRLDGLVHAAALFVALRPLLHQPADEWFRILQTALTGPFLLTGALMPLLGEQGRVVFVNDGRCIDKPANWAAYGVAQAGRRQLVRQLAAEAGANGPRFLEVDPGPFYSGLHAAARPSVAPDELPTAAQAASAVLDAINESAGLD
ncbi:SDR family NAD(P)-dependent oxidoreductase [Wenzhouxiangella sp. AB-CW3]|uniref:SDR family NAD(P)-dependent oxidoreductase n=1 Tax=Wenzhouxiangella sp. AB-CW3 TaxID=2771012 RepID=UPI00168AF27F|nr:SDR family NAD(P)-dependent oxidoreductase [Wenzhouxiangella sp. AB-CW3]QOC21124.1 SDR family NAD(P)-dependent oxidoreductase [Wenzhouxiangella sp. AB-CW3]